MSDDGDNYHVHQQKWEELREWGENHPEEWEEDELLNNEELEREGRERVREEHGDDANEGHDDRIEKLKDTEQTIQNRIAWCKGEYSYDDEEQGDEQVIDEGDEGYEGGEGGEGDEAVDMDIDSDSDSD